LGVTTPDIPIFLCPKGWGQVYM